jgi:hypothetical protein
MSTKHVNRKTGEVIWKDNEGNPHKDDGPAVIRDHSLYYYRHGKLHREDGPAIVTNELKTHYYFNGRVVRGVHDNDEYARKIEFLRISEVIDE